MLFFGNPLADDDGKYKTWVWVFGIKPKILSDLSNLSEVPLKTYIEKSNENLDKTDKTDKTAIGEANQNLSFVPNIVASKTDKNLTSQSIEISE